MLQKLKNVFFYKEPTAAQLSTCYVLAVRVYRYVYGQSREAAAELAFQRVKDWIEQDKVHIALKELWKRKVA